MLFHNLPNKSELITTAVVFSLCKEAMDAGYITHYESPFPILIEGRMSKIASDFVLYRTIPVFDFVHHGTNLYPVVEFLKALMETRLPKHEHKVAICAMLFDKFVDIDATEEKNNMGIFEDGSRS